jgi:hypothetical protein
MAAQLKMAGVSLPVVTRYCMPSWSNYFVMRPDSSMGQSGIIRSNACAFPSEAKAFTYASIVPIAVAFSAALGRLFFRRKV